MDQRFEDVETDSTVDNTLDQMDTSDPEIHFCMQVRGIDAGQLLAGDVGLWDPGHTRTRARPLTQTLSVTSLHTSRPGTAVQLPRPAQLLKPTAFGAARHTPRRTKQRSCTMVHIMQHPELRL